MTGDTGSAGGPGAPGRDGLTGQPGKDGNPGDRGTDGADVRPSNNDPFMLACAHHPAACLCTCMSFLGN